jgi:hypothetical protein
LVNWLKNGAEDDVSECATEWASLGESFDLRECLVVVGIGLVPAGVVGFVEKVEDREKGV